MPQLHSTELSAKAEELRVRPSATTAKSATVYSLAQLRANRASDSEQRWAPERSRLQGLYMYGCKVDIRATVTRLSRRFLPQARDTHLRSVESLSQSVASVSLSLRVARCKESPPRGSRRPPVRRFESALRASDVPTEAEAEGVSLWPLSPGVSAR